MLVPVVVVLVAAGGADEALVIVVPLPPPSLKPIAIPATAAAPSRASAGPFQLTGGHVSGLAGDVARRTLLVRPLAASTLANRWRNGLKTS